VLIGRGGNDTLFGDNTDFFVAVTVGTVGGETALRARLATTRCGLDPTMTGWTAVRVPTTATVRLGPTGRDAARRSRERLDAVLLATNSLGAWPKADSQMVRRPSSRRQHLRAARAARKWLDLLARQLRPARSGTEVRRRLLDAFGGAVAFGLGAFSFFFGEPAAEVAVLDEGGQGVEDHARAEQRGHLGGVVGG
jgi:hypothetical protein